MQKEEKLNKPIEIKSNQFQENKSTNNIPTSENKIPNRGNDDQQSKSVRIKNLADMLKTKLGGTYAPPSMTKKSEEIKKDPTKPQAVELIAQKPIVKDKKKRSKKIFFNDES